MRRSRLFGCRPKPGQGPSVSKQAAFSAYLRGLNAPFTGTYQGGATAGGTMESPLSLDDLDEHSLSPPSRRNASGAPQANSAGQRPLERQRREPERPAEMPTDVMTEKVFLVARCKMKRLIQDHDVATTTKRVRDFSETVKKLHSTLFAKEREIRNNKSTEVVFVERFLHNSAQSLLSHTRLVTFDDFFAYGAARLDCSLLFYTARDLFYIIQRFTFLTHVTRQTGDNPPRRRYFFAHSSGALSSFTSCIKALLLLHMLERDTLRAGHIYAVFKWVMLLRAETGPINLSVEGGRPSSGGRGAQMVSAEVYCLERLLAPPPNGNQGLLCSLSVSECFQVLKLCTARRQRNSIYSSNENLSVPTSGLIPSHLLSSVTSECVGLFSRLDTMSVLVERPSPHSSHEGDTFTVRLERIPLLCSAIIESQLFTDATANLLVSFVPILIQNVDLLTRGEYFVSTMNAYHYLKYDGSLQHFENLDAKVRDLNFYFVMAEKASTYLDELDIDNINTITRICEEHHFTCDLWEAAAASSLRMRNVNKASDMTYRT